MRGIVTLSRKGYLLDTLTLLYAVGGLGLMAISIPLALGKVPPNILYGFRVRATLEHADLWYPTNRYAGQRLFVVGLVSALFAPLWRLLPGMTPDAYALFCGGFIVACLLLTVAQSMRYLHALEHGRDRFGPATDSNAERNVNP